MSYHLFLGSSKMRKSVEVKKKAIFVGNVNQDFDRQSPVKVIYLDKGLNVSVEDDYESGLDIDELKESVSVVG